MPDDGDARFHATSHLTAAHWLDLQRVVQRRVLRYFRTQGLLDEAGADGMFSGGFSIDASVRIEGDDRAGVERLLRYCARPPFALERLHAPTGIAALASNDSRLVYRLPKPAPDGRTELRLTPLELLERLARLIPPPRIHRHRYHGVLAPNAKLRAAVVAIGRPDVEAPEAEFADPVPPHAAPRDDAPAPPTNRARIRWAVLLARIYGVLPLLCPGCGGDMKILAFLTDPPVVSRILVHLELHHLPSG
jgi:Putative transposase